VDKQSALLAHKASSTANERKSSRPGPLSIPRKMTLKWDLHHIWFAYATRARP
jgi:hypothetical protein